MKILSLVSQKGGAGKSILTVHLAVAFESIGITTAVIDLDPQASVGQWGAARGDKPPIVVTGLVERLPRMMTKAREGGVSLVIIDTPPHSDKNAVGAVGVSDLILLPARPQAFDLRSLADTVQVLKVADRLNRAWVVLNHIPPRGDTRVGEAQDFVAPYGLQVAPVRITQRAAFGDAIIGNMGITEYEPKGKAAAEIEALRAFVIKQFGMKI